MVQPRHVLQSLGNALSPLQKACMTCHDDGRWIHAQDSHHRDLSSCLHQPEGSLKPPGGHLKMLQLTMVACNDGINSLGISCVIQTHLSCGHQFGRWWARRPWRHVDCCAQRMCRRGRGQRDIGQAPVGSDEFCQATLPCPCWLISPAACSWSGRM